MKRVLPLFCWAFLLWVIITWTLTIEQVAFGAGISLAVAVPLAPGRCAPRPRPSA